MKGVRKPFERDVYNQCDAMAKTAVALHLTCTGYDVKVPPENYGADLYHRHPRNRDLVVHHEVEVSLGWGDHEFPYPTGSIPERKIRLTKLVQGPLFFWMLNKSCNRAVVFSSRYLDDRYLRHVPNKKVAEGEYFYRPPLECGHIIDPLLRGIDE